MVLHEWNVSIGEILIEEENVAENGEIIPHHVVDLEEALSLPILSISLLTLFLSRGHLASTVHVSTRTTFARCLEGVGVNEERSLQKGD